MCDIVPGSEISLTQNLTGSVVIYCDSLFQSQRFLTNNLTF